VIASFACKETAKIWERGLSRKLDERMQQAALRKLRMLDSAVSLQDLAVLPGNRLEMLRGNRKGQCSIRVNDQWRICFRWHSDRAHDVEIVDYH